MRKSILYFFLPAMVLFFAASCEKDDSDFSQYKLTDGTDDDDDDDDPMTSASDTICIVWNGASVSVTGDKDGYVTTSGADVTVDTGEDADSLMLVLSGTTDDGSLLVNRSKKYTILLNGVDITNADGPAINNQCSKSLYLICADGTTNTLKDGTAYADKSYQQKGALFSEGQTFFSGAGTLNVYGNCKNAIACDDYITIEGDIIINAVTSETGTNGIKANDGMYINGGTLKIKVASDGGRGIRCDSYVNITGGNTTITTSGDCVIEKNAEGVADTTSAAGIKCDSLFTMSGGSLTISSSGDGGKGIRCDQNVEFSGGTLVVKTTGDNDVSKPKGIKSDTGIIVSGGSFSVSVNKSWACDNGSNSEVPSAQLTVLGTPASSSIEKKKVVITY